MTTKEIVIKLLFGEMVMINDDQQEKEIQIMLRQIKSNCTEVLSQLNENLKNKKK